MDSKNIIPMLDKVASRLEAKGLLKEAEMLDVIANTIEKVAYTPPATLMNKLRNAIKNAEEATTLVKENSTKYEFTQEKFDKLLDPVEDAVSNLLNHFEGLNRIHFGDKGGHERYPKYEVNALDVKPEDSNDSAADMLSVLLNNLSKIEEYLNRSRDVADVHKLVPSLNHILKEWERSVPIISDAQ